MVVKSDHLWSVGLEGDNQRKEANAEELFTFLRIAMFWPWSKPPPPAAPPTWLEYATVVVEQNVAAAPFEAVALALMLGLCLAVAAVLLTPSQDPVEEKVRAAEKRRRAFRKNIVDMTFRALKTVAMADGVFHPNERSLLADVAESLTVVCPDLDGLAPIEPEALARRMPDGSMRFRLIVLMLHVALVDGHEDKREYAVVKRFATALELSTARLEELRRAVEKQHRAAKSSLTKQKSGGGPGALSRGQSSDVLLASSVDFHAVLQSLCHR